MPTLLRSNSADTAHQPPQRRRWRFVAHYIEMVVAMLVGMALLGTVRNLVWPGLTAGPAIDVLLMATDMTVGMAIWMKIRRHSLANIAEMSAAMYLPFLLLLGPFLAHWISAGTLMTAGHILMLPTMALAMWRHSTGAKHH